MTTRVIVSSFCVQDQGWATLVEVRSFTKITEVNLARRCCIQEHAALVFIEACACDTLRVCDSFLFLRINQVKYRVFWPFDVPHVDSVFVSSDEGVLIWARAY